jgi:hypothetical protein
MSCLCYRIVNNTCIWSTTTMAQGWTICPSSLGTRNHKGVTLLVLTLHLIFALVSLFYNSQYRDYSILETYVQYYFNTCTVHLLLFCTMTKKRTIISQIITLLHVSTLLCHPQGVHSYYLVNLHKYVKCSCGSYNLKFKIISHRFMPLKS